MKRFCLIMRSHSPYHITRSQVEPVGDTMGMSHLNAEIKSEGGGGINYIECYQQQLLVTLDVLKGHKI